MAETVVETVGRRSALAEIYRPGTFGPPDPNGPGIELAERRALAIVEVQAWPDTAAAVARDLGAATGLDIADEPGAVASRSDGRQDEASAICFAPGRWLVVEKERRDLYGLVRAAAGEGRAAVTDQGHGRVVLRVGGRNLRDLLSKGTPLDLRPRRFPPGRGAATRLEHFAILLHCLDAELFDLFVLRSYGVSLYEWLLDAALEFGCRVHDPI